jgi:hypothetical protein
VVELEGSVLPDWAAGGTGLAGSDEMQLHKTIYSMSKVDRRPSAARLLHRLEILGDLKRCARRLLDVLDGDALPNDQRDQQEGPQPHLGELDEVEDAVLAVDVEDALGDINPTVARA